MRISGEIERVSGISAEEFHLRYVRPEIPVIIEGEILGMRAFEKWDPPYLREILGSAPIKYKVSERALHPNFYETELKEMFRVQAASFAEYLDLITTGPENERARYLFTGDEQFVYRVREGKAEVNEVLAPLWRDAHVPEFVPEDKLYSVWSWFSAAGVRTWLHYDNNECHNLNAQIRGKKRCLLFDRSQLSKLAMFPPEGNNPAHNCSQIDVFDPDFSRFPEFSDAQAVEGDVQAGDLLFIPADWSHAFEHRGAFNANVNFWWKPASGG